MAVTRRPPYKPIQWTEPAGMQPEQNMQSTPSDLPRRVRFGNPPDAACTFCGKTRRETGIMVEGPKDDLYICRNCADLVRNIFEAIAREQQAQSDPTK
jgi:hypothetical protein